MKQVSLRLSSDGKKLVYEGNKTGQSCWNILRTSTKVLLSNFVEIMYGGETTAFNKVSTAMFRIHAKNRQGMTRVFKHYDTRRSILIAKGGNNLPLWQDTNFTEPREEVKKLSEPSLVYNWQYVSFVRRDRTTLDLIVRNEKDMMSLINVV